MREQINKYICSLQLWVTMSLYHWLQTWAPESSSSLATSTCPSMDASISAVCISSVLCSCTVSTVCKTITLDWRIIDKHCRLVIVQLQLWVLFNQAITSLHKFTILSKDSSKCLYYSTSPIVRRVRPGAKLQKMPDYRKYFLLLV